LVRDHFLLAADAIQLACALKSRAAMPDHEFVFIGGDLELNAAAQMNGFAVIDPTTP
jgi:hypothetical protein